jgi:hypothetical protein
MLLDTYQEIILQPLKFRLCISLKLWCLSGSFLWKDADLKAVFHFNVLGLEEQEETQWKT